ncbi:MAG: winged helix-turn-helix domain-containing protein [Pirellulales bacterium]|jgi:hypothetical protein|nr:winged helix-turn-helix domain-containing protein [Thermoguttaceae bacterium]MDD4786118.1 winged helix-turn-helix domain-containing protein [Pirellulales bacterium]MDI9442829.1 winged helix-turn-helix domain-containing protein [Planctomycetota bacterium]NLY99576.1 winged helix-turn-helix domain-containing protein [Pirellulaceae bacterium]
MANDAGSDSLVAGIGLIAGKVWQTLDAEGPLSFGRLVKKVGAPRDSVMQGLGWLAREDKVRIVEQGRTRIVSLGK